MVKNLFVSSLVVIPEGSFLDIAGRELPVLFGPVDPFQEALLLLIPGQVKEEFEDNDTVVDEVPLKVVDLAETTPP
jgi:hypothetical protein